MSGFGDMLATIGPPGEDAPWMKAALCAQVDPEMWFPEKGGSTRDAKAVCLACPVRRLCLDYALRHDERFGVWGGVSERARRKMRPESESVAA